MAGEVTPNCVTQVTGVTVVTDSGFRSSYPENRVTSQIGQGSPGSPGVTGKRAPELGKLEKVAPVTPVTAGHAVRDMDQNWSHSVIGYCSG